MYMLYFNFILGSNFISLRFGGMVMYDNKFKTKLNVKVLMYTFLFTNVTDDL